MKKYLTSLPIMILLCAGEVHAEYQFKLNDMERNAITRVAYAEAGNQGTKGITAVINTILNRYQSKEFGDSIFDVLNARNQFEPVTKVGGWENLPEPTVKQISAVNAVLDLVLDGSLPDITNGALYFQNPAIVKAREVNGEVSQGLTNFGGQKPLVTINDHAFYAEYKKYGGRKKEPHAPPSFEHSAPLYAEAEESDLYAD